MSEDNRSTTDPQSLRRRGDPQLDWIIVKEAHQHTLLFQGEWDMATADNATEALEVASKDAQDISRFVLDLSGLDFLECRAMDAIGTLRSELVSRSIRFELWMAPSGPVRRVVSVLGPMAGVTEVTMVNRDQWLDTVVQNGAGRQDE